MKNVLFATSALIGVAAFASTASAQAISFSGTGEMGVTYVDDGNNENVEFHREVDLDVSMSGSTNNLAFGASLNLEDALNNGTVNAAGSSVFISGPFGTLTMGDIDGGYDFALAGIAAGGLNDEGDIASGQSGLDGITGTNIARYDYAFGDLTVSGSLELEEGVIDNIFGLGVTYNAALAGVDLGVGLGAQFTSTDNPGGLGDGDHIFYGGSLVAGFGAFEAIGVVEVVDRPSDSVLEDGEIFGVSGQYTTGPISVALGYELNTTNPNGGGDVNTFQGFTTYDLGGGAELVAAASYAEDDNFEQTLVGGGIGLSF